jgi:hypothetical protein
VRQNSVDGTKMCRDKIEGNRSETVGDEELVPPTTSAQTGSVVEIVRRSGHVRTISSDGRKRVDPIRVGRINGSWVPCSEQSWTETVPQLGDERVTSR